MRTVYIVIIEDRHCEPSVESFEEAEDAIAWSRAYVRSSDPASLDEELTPAMQEAGWLYYGCYSLEGDHVRVVPSLLRTPPEETIYQEMLRDYNSCPEPEWSGSGPVGGVLTLAQLHAEAARRFGPDPMKWAFVCPRCSDVASLQDFVTAGVDPNCCGQECLGRSLGAPAFDSRDGLLDGAVRGCNWAAYGFFSGPWYVLMPPEEGVSDTRKIPGFQLAPSAGSL